MFYIFIIIINYQAYTKINTKAKWDTRLNSSNCQVKSQINFNRFLNVNKNYSEEY